MEKKNILIISAVDFEVIPLRRLLHAKNINLDFFCFGIGALNAAKNHNKIRENVRGKDVIIIGTCGAFQPFSGVRLVTSHQWLWLPTSERLDKSEPIENLHPPVDKESSLLFSDLEPCKTLCCNNISTTNFISNSCKKKYQLSDSLLLENLEIYALAEALETAQSVHVCLAITNEVGEMGRRQWKENFKAAAELTASYVYQKIIERLEKKQGGV